MSSIVGAGSLIWGTLHLGLQVTPPTQNSTGDTLVVSFCVKELLHPFPHAKCCANPGNPPSQHSVMV